MFRSQRAFIFGIILLMYVGGANQMWSQDPATATDTQESAKMAQDTDTLRREHIMESNQALQGGEVYLQAGNWAKAEERFQYVLKMTSPDADGRGVYLEAQRGLAKVYVGEATDSIHQNNFDDAQKLLDQAQALDALNKDLPATRKLLAETQATAEAQHRNPESLVNNPALTPEFEQKIADVQRLLFEGDRFFDTGQYDKADSRFRQALVIDPYNKAARLRLDKLERYRDIAAKTAHDTAREEAMYNVDRLWHEVEKPDDIQASEAAEQTSQESNAAKIQYKLANIKIPEITFNETPIDDALNQLMGKSRELDPDKEGINLVIKTQSAAPAVPEATSANGVAAQAVAGAAGSNTPPPAPVIVTPPPITLHLTDVPLGEALRVVAQLAGLRVKIEEYAVLVVPVSDTTSALVTRTFNCPVGFISGGLTAPNPNGAGGVNPRPGSLLSATLGEGVDAIRIDAKQQLMDQGVQFPNGATASYLAGSSKLVVRNTAENLDFIDTLIQARQTEEPQIEIETKYVEFTDTALKALTFNWAISPLNDLNTLPMIEGPNGQLAIPTPGTAYNALTDIFLPPSSSQNLHTNYVNTGGATANRNQTEIPQDGLDNILAASSVDSVTNAAVASNQLFLGAVLGNNAFGLIANMIDQLKGVDLLSAPKVTVKSHTEGRVEIAREMRYPTNFQAPKFNGTPIQFDGNDSVMLLPPTPSDFQAESIGVVLDVTPVANPDRTIDLTLKPKVTDFEGFINYGSTIYEGRLQGPLINAITQSVNGTTGYEFLDPPIPNTQPLLTSIGAYKLQQPVFNNRSFNTSLRIVDGQTVVMGGLVREDRDVIDDKVPLLGDLPLAGRLFRSKVTQTTKRNLVVFVTARLIRPTGKPKYMQDTGDAVIPASDTVPAASETTAPAKNS